MEVLKFCLERFFINLSIFKGLYVLRKPPCTYGDALITTNSTKEDIFVFLGFKVIYSDYIHWYLIHTSLVKALRVSLRIFAWRITWNYAYYSPFNASNFNIQKVKAGCNNQTKLKAWWTRLVSRMLIPRSM